jgi:hypothetical protein
MLNLRQLNGEYNGLEEKVKFIFSCYPKSLQDTRIRRVVEMLAGRGSREQQVENLYNRLKAVVGYIPDPVGVEYTKSPSIMLDEIERRGYTAGDCDDLSCLGYTALMTMGVSAGVRVIWRGGAMPAHIYTLAVLYGHPYPFDLAGKSLSFGEEGSNTGRRDFYA